MGAKSHVAEVNVYEVTFTVEGVDDEGEFFTDGQSALVLANSVEHCLELVKDMRTYQGENVVGIEGIQLFAESLIVPDSLAKL